MLACLTLLIFPVRVICGHVSRPLGVDPKLQSLYIPSPSSPPTWNCLNDTEVIPWMSVNDDYCDCPDGSDEPGTSACPDGFFYCLNEGHIGSRIPSSRVNDGLCEPECCDGSDEPSGVCPNRCKEIGEAYAQKTAAEHKIRKTGAKIRSSYITFAQKEKKRLEDSIVLLEREVAVREKDVARLKDIMDRTDSLSAAALQFKKQSPLYQSLLIHRNALKSLRKVHKNHLNREKQLGEILEALKGGYNPNYQDMAVLEAVRGWEALSGEKKEESADSADTPEVEEGEWTEEQLEHQLDEVVLNQDYVSLLLQHESHLNQEATSLLLDLSSYIPDSFAPQYNRLCDTAVGWLRTLGIIRGSRANMDESSQARAAYNDAESKYISAKGKKRDDEDELAELFDPEGFGRKGEWKKLQGLCLSKDTGEYTYEVCLFGQATQKAGGAHHNLGSFSSWSKEPNVKPGDPRYYQTQYYTGGTKCWNGPERSVTLHLTCGTENKILSIAEPEKCEYHLNGETPALCLPLEASTREEL